MFNKIYDRTFNLWGADLRIRFEPREFKTLVRTISKLIDQGSYAEAKLLIEEAYFTWDHDSEIVRLGTLCSFMSDE